MGHYWSEMCDPEPCYAAAPKKETPVRELDVAVQLLVDHDREDQQRIRQRMDLVKKIDEEVRKLGHYPCHESDPLVFRCGNIVVTMPAEHIVKWECVRPLEAAKAE